MQVYNDWQTDVTYSFDSAVPGILPTSYQQVKLMSKCNFDIAKLIGGSNAYVMWRRIFPSLAGVVDDPSAVDWLVFKSINQNTQSQGPQTEPEMIVLANVWILSSTVTPVEFVQQRIVLTETSDAQVAQVTAFLTAIQAKFTSERIYR